LVRTVVPFFAINFSYSSNFRESVRSRVGKTSGHAKIREKPATKCSEWRAQFYHEEYPHTTHFSRIPPIQVELPVGCVWLYRSLAPHRFNGGLPVIAARSARRHLEIRLRTATVLDSTWLCVMTGCFIHLGFLGMCRPVDERV